MFVCLNDVTVRNQPYYICGKIRKFTLRYRLILMTPDKLKTIIAHKEGTEIEFKESKDSLARKVYESICAFLNRRGGHVVLGAKDNGEL